MDNLLEELPNWVWAIAIILGASLFNHFMTKYREKDDEAVFALEESGEASHAEQLILFRMNELKELITYLAVPLYLIFALLAYVVFGK